MKKTLLICAGLIFLFINARIIYEILTPPGEKVRARLAQVAEDFNEGRPGPCTSGLADQFVDETTKITKPEIRGLLARLALTEKDPQSGHFPYRVQLQLKELGYKVSSGTPRRCVLNSMRPLKSSGERSGISSGKSRSLPIWRRSMVGKSCDRPTRPWPADVFADLSSLC